jgi:hypothetical protein
MASMLNLGIGQNLLSSAEEVVLNVRRKQSILLGILIMLQSHCRVFLAKRYVKRQRGLTVKKAQPPTSSAEPEPDDIVSSDAVIRIQAWFRRAALRRKFLLLRFAASRIAAIIRGRKLRFAYMILLRAVCLSQAAIRGSILRKRLSFILSRRLEMYQRCIFLCWQRAHTPLSYRTKFWPLIQKHGNGFLQHALADTELHRLWTELGVMTPVDIASDLQCDVDQTMRVAASIGISNVCYWAAKKVCNSHVSDAPPVVRRRASMSSMSSIVKTEEAQEGTLVAPRLTSREAAERVQVYERLSAPRISEELPSLCEHFSVPRKEKLKKALLAKSVCKFKVHCDLGL